MQICYKRMLLTVQAVEHDLSRGHAPDPEDHYKYRGYVTLSKCEKLSHVLWLLLVFQFTQSETRYTCTVSLLLKLE